ncbi:MAG: translation initiation factor IF-3 [Candidatus Komeilibacteria bacterium]|nr:translation initiation factor IF-3 [Candidatus Komeilibacteria bacterium]
MLRTKGKRKKFIPVDKFAYRINERIRSPKVRVIDENGAQAGVLDIAQALAIAREKELDLIEVFPKSDPPVCKILDYGQFQYQQSRKTQELKSKVKKTETKGIRLSYKIGQHDLDFKKEQALKFLSKGDKVRIEIILRGREKQYAFNTRDKIMEFINTLKQETDVTMEQPPKKLGNQISVLIAPAGKNAAPSEKTNEANN